MCVIERVIEATRTLDHLRRQVVQRAAQGLAARVGRMHGPAKIGDLDLTIETCGKE